MKNLTTAIYSKFTATTEGSHNSLYTSIGGRMYENEAPEGADFPYCVYMVVSDVPEYPGGKTIEQTLIQFSLFSSLSSSSEIKDMLAYLQALYDDCSLTITANDLIYFIRGSLTPMRDEVTTSSGTSGVWHYAQEYDLEMVK